MKLLDTLREEHALIERVTLSLHAFVNKHESGEVARGDAASYLRFFRFYVGRHHHRLEEEVLFPALVQQTEAPLDRGPLCVMLEDHRALAGALDELAPLLGGRLGGSADAARLQALSARFERALLLHVDAENGVLFPESEARLRRAGVRELPERWLDPEEEAAAEEGAELVSRHPPTDLTDMFRGGSCVTCEAFGTRCAGVEREWSSDLEWEDMVDRIG